MKRSQSVGRSLLLSLALLLAQWGALAHALEHGHDACHETTVVDQTAIDAACAICLAFGATVAAPGPLLQRGQGLWLTESPSTASPASPCFADGGYLARAPPVP